MAHKVTFRFDDDAWAILRRISESAGLSVTAMVQGAVEVWGHHWQENDWAPPHEWTADDGLTQAWRQAIEAGRRIDARRRARPGGRNPPDVGDQPG